MSRTLVIRCGFAVLVALLAACGGEDNPTGPGNGTGPDDCPDPAQGARTERDIVFPGDRFDFEEIPSGTDPRLRLSMSVL